MNNFVKKEWTFLILLIIPFLIGIYVYPHFPEQVPTHWNVHGEVDGYSSREFGAFGLPAINLGMYILLLVTPYIDPKKKNYEKFSSTYRYLRYLMHIFFGALYCLTIMAALGYQIDVGLWIAAGVAILFIALGNIMGRIRHNYFVGFRLPWTLANEDVWRKTHLVGSKLMVAGGVVGLIGVLLTESTLRFIILMLALFLPMIITGVYSYLYFRKVSEQ